MKMLMDVLVTCGHSHLIDLCIFSFMTAGDDIFWTVGKVKLYRKGDLKIFRVCVMVPSLA